MQGIFRLLVLAAWIEAVIARPQERTAPVMAGVWLRPGPLQAGVISDTPPPPGPAPAYPSQPPRPRLTVMNAALAARDLRGSLRTPSIRDNRRKTTDKSLVTPRDPRRRHRGAPPHGNRRLRRRPSQPPKRPPPATPAPLTWPIKTPGGRRRGSRTLRLKRSVVQGTIVRYSGSRNVKFRLQGPLALYLTLAPSGGGLTLSHFQADRSCFQVHMFEEIPASREGGWPVMLQVHGGGYLHANAPGLLSLRTRAAGVAAVTHVDGSFFRLSSYTGDNTINMKHILTGLHIQATVNAVSLVSANPAAAEGMLFHEFECT
ncbi:uncharacterized protein LOC126987591 isoform X1 [Eriocheir sinensis]|uniref:uncharacterized protein LOC126987591 isoform X1 n=2 Tax=Eriocheir sinensis TaxID=95602 RepID=UPI0021C85517|nr:uncharacterized protein LOC126987591 isoform X1 [Eriocheir sinensis]